MFDTPDLAPLCLAPFIACFVGFFVYVFSSIIKLSVEKRTGKNLSWLESVISFAIIIIVPFTCAASVLLNIGASDPKPWFEPTQQNIVGDWQIASSTISALENRNDFLVLPHSLTFKSDGTFTVTNIPNLWEDLRDLEVDQKYITGSGTWQIAQKNETHLVIVKFHAMTLDQYQNSEIPFYFEKHLPPYQLVIRGFEGKESSLMFRFDKQ